MAQISLNHSQTNSLTEGSVKKTKKRTILGSFKNFFKKQFSESPSEQDDFTDSGYNFEATASNRQGDAWVQACYNAVAMVFVFITGCVILAVYYVMEPFMQPLLWAVLVGMVLHPFKYICTSEITQWLHSIQNAGSPLSLWAVVTPLVFFNWLSVKLEGIVMANLQPIVKITLGVLVVMVIYLLNLPFHLYWAFQGLWQLFEYASVVIQAPLYLSVSFYVVMLTNNTNVLNTVFSQIMVMACLTNCDL